MGALLVLDVYECFAAQVTLELEGSFFFKPCL